MNDRMNVESILKNESVETLMLICSIDGSPYRQQAFQELQRRRMYSSEQHDDDIMTNLSMVILN